MRKRLIAGLIMFCVLCSASYAEDEDSSWTGYFTGAWDSMYDYVAGWFTGDDDTESKTETKKETLPPHIASEWDELTNTLGDTLTLRDKQEKLPDYALFGEDKNTNGKKINALLDRAISMLTNGEAGDIRKQSEELKAKIKSQRLELDELRNKRITAPDKTSMFTFWKMTRSKADVKISELEESIRHNEESLTEVNAKLTNALRNVGLELEESQIDILMNSATGDDLMQNTIIFTNVKSIVAKLEELAQNDTNSLETTRKYTGMYLVLNDLLIHTQEELVRKIDGEYKPKLNVIIREAQDLRNDALRKSRMNTYSQTQRDSFELNAESNGMTIRVARLYIDLLNSQRAGTMESIKSLKLNRDLAENTYRTVRSSGELRSLIHSGLSLFDAVNELKMPELKIFESDAMRVEFEKISGRLKK
ncbi:MAG: hypothetical protein IJG55_03170 [Synergistaceae bacterium]|nr:hypothetical protein [Synergistaceae bacterium]